MPTPRGIDRIEFGLGNYFFREWPAECVAILPTPWGVRCFEREFGVKILDLLAARWKENLSASEDPASSFVKSALRGEQKLRRHRSSTSTPQAWQSVLARIYEIYREIGLIPGASAVRSTPHGSAYLNLGHSGLAVGSLLRWLKFRADVTSVFMIHDTIPLDHPEFVTSNAGALFKKMVANTRSRAQALIVTTDVAKRSVLTALGEGAPPSERIFACALPVNDIFRRLERDKEVAGQSYFVFCSSIEPRKNLLLLLSIWSKIVSVRGSTAPTLIVVGARTSRICETAAMLDRCANLEGHLIEVEGLSTGGLQELLAGARALLMPSYVEGFGIPIIEALASGTPVIASDIEAHREVGGDVARYIDPTDGPTWMKEIISLHDHPRTVTGAKIRDWPSYCCDLADFITTVVKPTHAE